MSLTSLLKSNSNAGELLRDIISIVEIDTDELSKQVAGTKIQAPYLLKNHSLASQVGTAFDYLARFVLKHYQYKVKGTAYNEQYVAKYGLDILLHYTTNENNKYEETYITALEILDRYIKGDDSKETFKRVIGISVYLAKLETIYRSGYTLEKENALKYKIEPIVEQELINQINIFINVFDKKFNFKTKPNTIYYNPSFELCSYAVGGADADIIIGDTLIDFKSSKYLKNIDKDYEQLVGYFLFAKIVDKYPDINKICLYFSRYGEFVEYEFTKEDKENINRAIKCMTYFIKTRLEDEIRNR